MQRKRAGKATKKTSFFPTALSYPVCREGLAQELLACALSLTRAPLFMLVIPSLSETPLIFSRKKKYEDFLRSHLDSLLPLLGQTWKTKNVTVAELKDPLPWVTLLPILGQKRTLGALILCTRRPPGKERTSFLKAALSAEGKILEHYLSAEEENARNRQEEELAVIREIHKGIAQELAGTSLFASALRQHIAACLSEDPESLTLLDAIDTGLRRSILRIQALLQSLHESVLVHSGFRKSLEDALKTRGPVVLRARTQDFAFPLKARKLFLEIAGEGETAVLRWSRKKEVRVKVGMYMGEAYFLFWGDGKEAQDFPFGPWYTRTLQEKISGAGGRFRVHHSRKGGMTIGVMVPAYAW